jgi:CheY-like chemotaxis protein
VSAVKEHACRLLDHTPRFKFFTLHGRAHLDSLFGILALLRKGGIELSSDQLFILCLAICIHDLGMVIPLRDREIKEILDGRPGFPDAAALEKYVRDRHHDLVESYFQNDLNFLLSLGIKPAQLSLVRDVSRCHRKVVLDQQTGWVRSLGALLRIIDELDIGPRRAPADVLLNIKADLDPTSAWHWFKHNIVDDWLEGHTVQFVTENGRKKILFDIVVHPTRLTSVDYWVRQVRRPIFKALIDDGAQKIVTDSFGVEIDARPQPDRSAVNNLGALWQELEERALSANKKVVLVIDDEIRKLEDLFLPLMESYHIMYAVSAKDAFSKLDAVPFVDLAIVDMQIGSGFMWSEHQTQDFKATGLNICEEIRKRWPRTKIGILTGTRYVLPDVSQLNLAFFVRKPVSPQEFVARVNHVLQ